MENCIKEQMCLFADRLSTDEMKGNQLRLYFSALAYTLMEALRRLALKGTGGPRPGRYHPPEAVQNRRHRAISVRRILLQLGRPILERSLRARLPRLALLKPAVGPPTYTSTLAYGSVLAEPCKNAPLITSKRALTRQKLHPTGQLHHAKALQQAHRTLNRGAESVMVRNAG